MSRKRLLIVGLVFAVGVLVVATLVGWWWVRLYEYPFLFPVAGYRLSNNWYIAEFQPVYLWKVKEGGATYLKVWYRNAEGEMVVGKVFGGGIKGQEIEAIPVLEIKGVYFLGQRIKVEYLLYKDSPDMEELAQYCEVSPRLCQVAKLTGEMQYSEALEVVEGKEPQMPVMALGVNTELKESQNFEESKE